ncbi:MAG: hydantoinase/oxoprolinase family protein [Sulfolobales archaeon]
MLLRLAVDIGGTFTDAVAIDSNGFIRFYKTHTTPRNPEIGFRNALIGGGFKEIEEVIHATTIATNTLLGQIGLEIPKVALFTTEGFRDIIEIGRQNRPELYNIYFRKPRTLVSREMRFEVKERINARGEVVRELDERDLEEKLLRARDLGATSIAISFLHSYINPSHEMRAREKALKYFKYVTASYEVAPEPREYERTSTTVVNALLMPIVSRYVEALKSILEEFRNPSLYIMTSSGGFVDPEESIRRPVQIIESGPAAGVIGSQAIAEALKIDKVISFDMGGTTAKAGTIVGGEIEIVTEYEVGGRSHHGRIVKGSGYPVRYPFIDLAEVSAGGGSIIWRDEGGALRVGPLSAGSDPGPMCYGRGGSMPTLTDANLVLGRIGETLLGGEFRVSRELALKGLKSLGDPIDIASEALEIANLEMARAIRIVTVERGFNPQDFTLVAFGGAGPQHSLDIAEELGIKRVLIPPHPGLFSALGMLFADERMEIRSSYPRDLEEEFRRLEEILRSRMRKIDFFVRYADVRYVGQGWELTIQLPGQGLSMDLVSKLFNEKHMSVYGFTMDRPIEIVTIRLFGVARYTKPRLPDPSRDLSPVIREYRHVYIDGEWVRAPVYVRESLPMNFKIEGPAIIEEYSSTILIKPGWSGYVEKFGSIILER